MSQYLHVLGRWWRGGYLWAGYGDYDRAWRGVLSVDDSHHVLFSVDTRVDAGDLSRVDGWSAARCARPVAGWPAVLASGRRASPAARTDI